MPPARLFRAFALSAVVAGLLAPVSAAASSGPKTQPKPKRSLLSAKNLLPNGSFEGSLNGWGGYRGKAALARAGSEGSFSARVTAGAGSKTFSFLTRQRPVRSAGAGDAYFASADVRSTRPGVKVCLRVREWEGRSDQDMAQSCVRTTTAWKAFPRVSYEVDGEGNDLDVYLYVMPAAAGDSFDVDDVTLVRADSGATTTQQPGSSAPAVTAAPVATTPPAQLPAPPAESPKSPEAPTSPPSASSPPASPAPPSAPSSPSSPSAPSAPSSASPPAPPAGSPASGLDAAAVDNAHIRLDWGPVAGASEYRVSRGPLVVGTTAQTTFTDTLLWPETTYGYTVEALSGATVVSTRTASAKTKALPGGGFQRFFPDASIWNTPVPSSPRLHADSAAMSAWFVAHARYPNLVTRSYGVSVAEAHSNDKIYTVPCTKYTCSLGAFGAFRIPVTAKQDPSDDGHLVVYDPASQREWGMWQARDGGSSWSAAAGAAVSLAGNGIAPRGVPSSNAAGFPLLGGLVRPEEILQGHIDHALVFAIDGVRSGPPVCPASFNAGDATDPYAFREGQKIQLDPAVDVEALSVPRWQKVVLKAAQQYGMYLRDGGGTLGIYAENPLSRGYDAWSLVGLSGGSPFFSTSVPWNRFRVLDAPDC